MNEKLELPLHISHDKFFCLTLEDKNSNVILESDYMNDDRLQEIVKRVNNYNALYDLVKQITSGPFIPAMWVGQAKEIIKQIEQ